MLFLFVLTIVTISCANGANPTNNITVRIAYMAYVTDMTRVGALSLALEQAKADGLVPDCNFR